MTIQPNVLVESLVSVFIPPHRDQGWAEVEREVIGLFNPSVAIQRGAHMCRRIGPITFGPHAPRCVRTSRCRAHLQVGVWAEPGEARDDGQEEAVCG